MPICVWERARPRPPGLFIMSMVPLNFGPAAPFSLKPHFWQAVAASGFWAPQLGQNNCVLLSNRLVETAVRTVPASLASVSANNNRRASLHLRPLVTVLRQRHTSESVRRTAFDQ